MNSETKPELLRTVYGTALFLVAAAVSILPSIIMFFAPGVQPYWLVWLSPSLFILLGLQWIIWPQTQLVVPHFAARIFGVVLVVGAAIHLLIWIFITCCFFT